MTKFLYTWILFVFITFNINAQCPTEIYNDIANSNCFKINWSDSPDYIPTLIIYKGIKLDEIPDMASTPLIRFYSDGSKCSFKDLIPFDGEISFYNQKGEEVICSYARGVLPIEMNNFTATNVSNGIGITWNALLSEQELGMQLEKSYDANNWEVLVWKSNLQPNINSQYNYIDTKIEIGSIYYRLKIVKKDGTSNFSKTITYTAISNKMFEITPNPSNSEITLKSNNQSIILSTKIFDYSGRIITQTLPKDKTLDIRSLEKGLYFIQIETPEGVFTDRFVKED